MKPDPEKIAKKLFDDEIVSYIDGYYLGTDEGAVNGPIIKAIAAALIAYASQESK